MSEVLIMKFFVGWNVSFVLLFWIVVLLVLSGSVYGVVVMLGSG